MQANSSSPAEVEFIRKIGFLKMHKATGPGGSVHIKVDKTPLITLDKEEFSMGQCTLFIVPNSKNSCRSSWCGNHRGFNLASFAPKRFSETFLHQLLGTNERRISENQADFHAEKSNIDQFLIAWQISGH